METAYSIINTNPTNKEEAEKFALKLISEVQSGMVNPLELWVKLNAMQKAFDEVKENISSMALSEAEKYGQKYFDAYSSQIQIMELAAKYNYSNCNDHEWNEAKDKEDEYAKERVKREKFLKALSKPMELVIEGTGEVAKIYPPSKSSKTGLKVVLK